MVKAKFLQSHTLFGGISDEDIEKIIPLLKEENFSKGEFILKEGEEGDRLYFLCKGSVEVLKEIHTETGLIQKRLAILSMGDTFGEMELIDIQHCAASVRALEKVSALTLSNADMYRIYKSNLEVFTMIVMNIAREISRRLRKMDALVGSSLYSESSDKEEPSELIEPTGRGNSR
jgi:CRP/FNR family cyclic AMP-dependent transcriptional regulator